jgi:hydrophobe/amphiphile efflux-1 (HAE1) family protein
MFGLVLAIGLLVDDAIVVVENVERVMTEEGLPAKEATEKAMGQITGALVGVALVISAVFVPVAFSGGSVGAIYREFALTIVVAMLLSVFVALTLTPALCATLLRPGDAPEEHPAGFFGWFNRGFDRTRDGYVAGVRRVIGRSGRWLAIYAACFAAVGLLFAKLPTSFLPNEDQGYFFVQVQTPPGATQERTGLVVADVMNYLLKDEAASVDAAFSINGNSPAGRGQNQAQVFVRLKDWSGRTGSGQSVDALLARVAKRYAGYPDAVVTAINPPPIRGLGSSAGFDFELEDRGGVGHDALMKARDDLLAMAKKDPAIAQLRANGLDDTPTFKVDVDREKASVLGVSLTDVDQAFAISWGSRFVNYFLDTDNRIKKVYLQADAPFRMNPQDLDRLYLRGSGGDMVPFSAFATGHWSYGPPQLQRYNGVSSVELIGQAAPGRSTGQAMQALETLAGKLPASIGFEWTGISLQQQQAGAQAPFFYALSVLVVFLSLAALYESWSIPVSVILVVPIGVLGALLGAASMRMTNGVYFQVGLLTTIGLAAKNAILIVEFARELMHDGRSALDAAVEAARLRLRPILMTSMAFILGVLPLALARGAGSASQNEIGVAVIGGMLTATFLAPFLIPMFFVVVSRLSRARGGRQPAGESRSPAA